MDDVSDGDDVWQRRFEWLGALALVAAAATPLAIGSQVFVNERLMSAYTTGAVDWVAVLRGFGRGAGVASAALVVAAFLLVAWGPGERISLRGSLVMQATIVIGLILSVVAGFALLDVLITGQGVMAAGGIGGDDPDLFTTIVARLGGGLPLAAAAALAGLGAWLAFTTLGEVPVEAVVDEDDDEIGSDAR